ISLNGQDKTDGYIPGKESVQAYSTPVCQNVTVQLDGSGQAVLLADDLDPDAPNYCGVVSTNISPANWDCADVGAPQTVTMTLTYANGSTNTCTAMANVEDQVFPTVACKDATVQLDDMGLVGIQASDVDDGSSDACGIATMTVSPNAFDCSHLGPNTVTLTVTDNNNNSNTCNATVTVLDVTAPVVSIGNQTGTVSCPAAAVAPTPPPATDNCDGTVSGVLASVQDLPDPVTCEGTRIFTYTYADGSGNTATWTYTFTIEYDDISMSADDGSTVACAADMVAPALPTVVDACGNTLSPTGPSVDPTPSCDGTVRYVYTYTDCAGHSHPWTYTYTIQRNDFTLPPDAGSPVACAADAVQPMPPSVNDNCGNAITPSGPVVSNAPACEGAITYTWTYEDCAGHSHPWTYTYTIQRN
ncbi:MAG TPA: hypothetical protein PKD45_05170, partial [Flavobacteriales bacterium]|nr:hypothetical protein [Flavobacteriales bacterium]